jgi:dTDP-3-amino-3,4,6-trideoxy-alpha-D-glucose transaminase
VANDFAARWEEIREDALAAVDRVGRSGWLVLGDEVRGFEEEFARWWGLPHAVGVASGLDALEIGLRLAGVQTGDRVLTTPLTAFATTLAVLRAGAEPVWCDVDDTGGMNLEIAVEALAADPSIKAVVPVHLYGHPLDPAKLERLAERGATVIEDCAQSAGASRDGRPTGSMGPLAATSLYPTKNLGALGDGGVLFAASQEQAERARTLRNYGQAGHYEHVAIGLNSRLDELQAAILRSALLPRLDAWLDRRRELAQRYADGLKGSALRVISPTGGRSAHHLLAVEVVDGDAGQIARALAEAGIMVGRHYPFLCPEAPACEGIGVRIGDFPVARRLVENELTLPLHPQLDDGSADYVIEACNSLPI